MSKKDEETRLNSLAEPVTVGEPAEPEFKNPEEMDDIEKWHLLSTVANLYYNSEMTQDQIANRIYTSRSKISRMLKEARELGIVEIQIHEPWDRKMVLEQRIQEHFPLKQIRVISVRENNLSMVLQKLGETAAYYLDTVVDRDTVLGISWGNTIYHTVRSIKSNKNIPLTVVPIMGAASISKPERDSLDLAKELAASYGGKYRYIYAPLFVKDKKLREQLVQDPNIMDVLNLARSANIILTSVGSIAYKTWKDYMSFEVLEDLEKKGAVGHIAGHFYDGKGREVRSALAERMIGIQLEDFCKAQDVICVAGMEEKAEAILGALRGGYIDTLITDEFAAARMLALLEQK